MDKMADFPRFAQDSNVSFNLAPGHLCTLCDRIPVFALPSEEENGYPHHLTLHSLKTSAQSCVMCALLYWAASCSIVTYGGMASFLSTRTSEAGEEYSFRGMESMYNGLGMRALENGAVMLDISPPVPDPRPPLEANLENKFPNGTITRNGKTEQVRPWLFGNYYKSAFVGRDEPLIIGLGIRLGTSARCEDSVDRDRGTVDIRGSYLRIRTDQEINAVPGRLRAWDSGSSYAFAKVKRWLSICDRYHQCLGNIKGTPLPTRILHCPRDRHEQVFLQETASDWGRYLALSHSWGSTHRLTLTKASLTRLKNGIRLCELPKTFQDAVAIACELDVPYVWIDSLCIIQDDEEDWERESSHMGAVYANAYLTIAASASEDDSSGCFPDPNTRYEDYFVSADVQSTGRRSLFFAAPVAAYEANDHRPTLAGRCHWAVYEVTAPDQSHRSWLYITPEWMPSSFKDHPKQYLIGEFGGRFDPIADQPLSDRGWTLQERLLSPRTINYGRTEMYWECQGCVFAEDGAMFRRTFTKADELWAPDPRESGKTSQWHWTRLVEEYSKRKLTKDFDKLPALSGLANLVAAKSGDIYLAGLWKGSLIAGLGWSVKAFEPSHHCDDPEHDLSMPAARKAAVKYPQQYRAPSWSWASVDTEIDYIHASSISDAACTAVLVDASVQPLGKDPFGRLAGGKLTLKASNTMSTLSSRFGVDMIQAPLYNLTPRELTGRSAIISPLHIGAYATWSNTRNRSVGVQHDGEVLTKEGQVLFDDTPLFPCKALFLTVKTALVLQPLGLKNYKRVGIGSFNGKRIGEADQPDFAEGSVQEVVIV